MTVLSVRQIRTVLWSSAAIFGAAAVVVLIAACWMPYVLPETSSQSIQPMSSDSQTPIVTTPDLADLRPLWALNLQRPLTDAEIKPPEPPPLRLQLLGTVVEGKTFQAILKTSDNQIVFMGVGDTVEQATIDAIEDKQVKLTYHQQTRILKVD